MGGPIGYFFSLNASPDKVSSSSDQQRPGGETRKSNTVAVTGGQKRHEEALVASWLGRSNVGLGPTSQGVQSNHWDARKGDAGLRKGKGKGRKKESS